MFINGNLPDQVSVLSYNISILWMIDAELVYNPHCSFLLGVFIIYTCFFDRSDAMSSSRRAWANSLRFASQARKMLQERKRRRWPGPNSWRRTVSWKRFKAQLMDLHKEMMWNNHDWGIEALCKIVQWLWLMIEDTLCTRLFLFEQNLLLYPVYRCGSSMGWLGRTTCGSIAYNWKYQFAHWVSFWIHSTRTLVLYSMKHMLSWRIQVSEAFR